MTMYKNILVPVALDHSRDTGKAVDVAQKLLDEGGTITLLTVLETIPTYVAQQIPAAALEDNRDEAKAALKADAGGAKNIKTAVVSGHAATTILDFAEEKGSDCIVIASHRPGLQDYFLGSTASRVVRHAKTCVHVIR
jgi:nucleotide-binding universal stress UspA family protein